MSPLVDERSSFASQQLRLFLRGMRLLRRAEPDRDGRPWLTRSIPLFRAPKLRPGYTFFQNAWGCCLARTPGSSLLEESPGLNDSCVGRVVDSLRTLMRAKPWASDCLSDFAHTLPTCHVSGGLNGTQQSKAETRPEASEAVPDIHPVQLPGQDSNLEKQDQNLL